MNILITGVGGPTPTGIARSIRCTSLGNMRLIGVDSSKYAPGLYNKELFDSTFLIPHSASDHYWSVMESIISREKIDYAFVVPELEVLEWSSRAKKGCLPCDALLPDFDVARVLYDKYETCRRLTSADLVPKTIKIETIDADKKIDEFLGYPFWVRKEFGAGAAGSYKLNDIEEFRNWKKLNPDPGAFIASEYLPGRIYACKILFHEGKAIRASCAERIDYLMALAAPSGISGMCARGKLINKPEIVDASMKALQIIFDSCKVAPHGMFTVDYREDKFGRPRITEINIRHVSFTFAFALCGANFALDSLMLYTNDPSFDRSFTIYEFDDEYTFIRGIDAELKVYRDQDFLELWSSDKSA